MLYIKVHVNLVLLPAVFLISNSQYITGMQDLEKVAGGIHVVHGICRTLRMRKWQVVFFLLM